MIANGQNSDIDNEVPGEGNNSNGFLAIVFSTFISVFLAELGDKTQIATLLLSAQSGKPFIVFVGASLALVCSSLVVVLLGRWLSKNIPQGRFAFLAGLLMISIGIWLGFQSLKSILYLNV
tara:strand:- start:186 stop:548 length:363 start_codon:yes stop_codon:yes gene_type:complete